MVYFIMLHAQLYFLFVFDFPEMVAPYLKCIFVWGSIKFLFLFNDVFNFKYLPLYNFKRFRNTFIFRHSIAVLIRMSKVCHNVHNVTHRVHTMLEQAQFNDMLR